jgi:hypothetical protein
MYLINIQPCFSYRGLPPHQFMPMLGVHKAINYVPAAPDARTSRRLLRRWGYEEMKFLTLFLLASLSGCAPWPTTSQPDVNLRVVDKNGDPIKGAEIKFANYKIAMKPEVEFKEIVTNSSGNAHLSKKIYTQMVVLAADGGHSYDWCYCIEKKGYVPVVRNNLNAAYFGKGAVVEKMSNTTQPKACQWQEYPHGYNVVAIKP